MTWHTEIVCKEEFVTLLATIRALGGTIMRSVPCPAGYSVTYITYNK
jgi:hypothetical protein